MTHTEAQQHQESQEPKNLEVRNTRKGFYISGNVKWITEVIVIIFAVGVGWATLSSQQTHMQTELQSQKETMKEELGKQYKVVEDLLRDRRDHEARISVLEEKMDNFKERLTDIRKLLEKMNDKLDER